MQKPTRLHRSHNYPYHNISEDVELEKHIDTESGTYLLTVLNEDGDFKLELPTDEEGKYDSITDSFNEFMDRAALYKRLDKGVLEFIQKTLDNLQTEYFKEKPVGKEIVMTMNNERYVLTIDTSTKMCKMEFPKRETEFYIDNIFIENPDLPLLKEGRLIQHFQEKVKKELGLSLPKTPYFPGLKLLPKD